MKEGGKQTKGEGGFLWVGEGGKQRRGGRGRGRGPHTCERRGSLGESCCVCTWGKRGEGFLCVKRGKGKRDSTCVTALIYFLCAFVTLG